MIKTTRLPLIVLPLFFCEPASAIVLDGNLADWGVKKNVGASGWTPLPGIHAAVEDQHDNYLGPAYGGQAYDAEALYALIDGPGNKLFIALATGHNPNTLHKPSANSYGAGDFAIDFGKDGTYELGINVLHTLSTGGAKEGFGVAGGVYRDPTWAWGLFNEVDPTYPDPAHPLPPTKRPAYLTGGTQIGTANMVYTTTGETGYGAWSGDKHYFYELSVGLDLLRQSGWDGSAFNVHWTMNCGNDSIFVDPPAPVPEPGTLALLPMGLLGLAALRRRLRSM